jgi:hypothetical protein
VALSQSSTDLVLVLDVDLVPCPGVQEYFRNDTNYTQLHTACFAKRFHIIPAFEVIMPNVPSNEMKFVQDQNNPEVPQTKEQLYALYSEEIVKGFHMKHYTTGHGPTNFAKWFDTNREFSVEYLEGFEPYGIVAKSLIPKYAIF